MTGPEHLAEGKRLLARAAEVHEGMLRGSIAQEAHAHLLAAQVIAFAAAHLPDRLSWQKAGDA
jgi:hypothetical protein